MHTSPYNSTQLQKRFGVLHERALFCASGFLGSRQNRRKRWASSGTQSWLPFVFRHRFCTVSASECKGPKRHVLTECAFLSPPVVVGLRDWASRLGSALLLNLLVLYAGTNISYVNDILGGGFNASSDGTQGIDAFDKLFGTGK